MSHKRLRPSVLGVTVLACVLGAIPAGVRPARIGPVLTTAGSAPSAPVFDIRRHRPGTAPGLIFTTPENSGMLGAPHGPEIIDGRGRPVWFQQIPADEWATDLRVQRYRGHRVLTWWQGTIGGGGNGHGTGYILDEHYRIIATVQGVTAPADLHEFRITRRDTALITEYEHVNMDLTPVGGPKNGSVLNGVVEEVDIPTGRVLWRWSSLEHVPITETDYPYAMAQGPPFDYFHLNSVDEDSRGDLLISSRHLSTVFKIDRRTGKIIWRLGGRMTTFPLGVGVRFSWQHDAIWTGKKTIRIFDNACVDPWKGYESRVSWVRVDPIHKRTRLIKQITHPEHLSATQEGGAQDLPNGDTMVSWGVAGRISEFSPDGGLLLDVALPKGWTSYRAYRFPWKGMPNSAPTATVRDGWVHVVWNGATGVVRWRLLAGASYATMKPVGQAAWNGFDTSITIPGNAKSARYVRVQALNGTGAVLAASAVVPMGR